MKLSLFKITILLFSNQGCEKAQASFLAQAMKGGVLALLTEST